MNAFAIAWIVTVLYVVALGTCVAMIIIGTSMEEKQVRKARCQLSDTLSVLDGTCPAGYRPPIGKANTDWRCPGCPNKPSAS